MTWRASLIRISTYEVETLQKRLGEVAARRADAEIRLTMLEAQAEAEKAHAAGDAEAQWPLAGFLAGVQTRRLVIQAQIDQLAAEEAGARDALSEAFETLKKFELVAENARLADAKEAARRETATLDEMGLRARAR
jgi:flagellar export protein FliJ